MQRALSENAYSNKGSPKYRRKADIQFDSKNKQEIVVKLQQINEQIALEGWALSDHSNNSPRQDTKMETLYNKKLKGNEIKRQESLLSTERKGQKSVIHSLIKRESEIIKPKMVSEGVGIQTDDLDIMPLALNDYLKEVEIKQDESMMTQYSHFGYLQSMKVNYSNEKDEQERENQNPIQPIGQNSIQSRVKQISKINLGTQSILRKQSSLKKAALDTPLRNSQNSHILLKTMISNKSKNLIKKNSNNNNETANYHPTKFPEIEEFLDSKIGKNLSYTNRSPLNSTSDYINMFHIREVRDRSQINTKRDVDESHMINYNTITSKSQNKLNPNQKTYNKGYSSLMSNNTQISIQNQSQFNGFQPNKLKINTQTVQQMLSNTHYDLPQIKKALHLQQEKNQSNYNLRNLPKIEKNQSLGLKNNHNFDMSPQPLITNDYLREINSYEKINKAKQKKTITPLNIIEKYHTIQEEENYNEASEYPQSNGQRKPLVRFLPERQNYSVLQQNTNSKTLRVDRSFDNYDYNNLESSLSSYKKNSFKNFLANIIPAQKQALLPYSKQKLGYNHNQTIIQDYSERGYQSAVNQKNHFKKLQQI